MKRLRLFVLLALTTACSTTRTGEAPVAADLAFIHVTVVDVESGRLLPDQTVLIAGHRIRALGPDARIRVPRGALVVNATGKYLIPGLWDFYTNALDAYAAGEPVMPLFLAHGVVGIRDVGTTLALDSAAAIRQRLAGGSLLGPQIVYGGRTLETPHRRALNGRVVVVRNADDVRHAVDSLARAGVDFIKVGPYITPAITSSVIAEARRHALASTGWIVSSWLDASNAGITSIEHFADLPRNSSKRRAEYHDFYLGGGPWHPSVVPRSAADTFFNELFASRDTSYFRATLETLAGNRTWIVMNHGTWGSLARDGDDPSRHRFRSQAQMNSFRAGAQGSPLLRSWAPRILSDFRAVHDARVPVIAGSGFSRISEATPGLTLHDALYWLTRGGFSPLEALQTATIHPARYMGAAVNSGTIAPGKRADLVLLDANPLDDIRNSTRIAGVMLGGRYLDRLALDALLGEAEAAARR